MKPSVDGPDVGRLVASTCLLAVAAAREVAGTGPVPRVVVGRAAPAPAERQKGVGTRNTSEERKRVNKKNASFSLRLRITPKEERNITRVNINNASLRRRRCKLMQELLCVHVLYRTLQLVEEEIIEIEAGTTSVGGGEEMGPPPPRILAYVLHSKHPGQGPEWEKDSGTPSFLHALCCFSMALLPSRGKAKMILRQERTCCTVVSLFDVLLRVTPSW